MDEFLHHAWEQLLGRLDGPLHLRLFLQPLMAAGFAIRAGAADARERRSPYLWSVLSNAGDRPRLLHETWRDVGKVFTVSCGLDIVYQAVLFQWIYPVQTLLVATLLALVPYGLVRGPVTRLLRRRPA